MLVLLKYHYRAASAENDADEQCSTMINVEKPEDIWPTFLRLTNGNAEFDLERGDFYLPQCNTPRWKQQHKRYVRVEI